MKHGEHGQAQSCSVEGPLRFLSPPEPHPSPSLHTAGRASLSEPLETTLPSRAGGRLG